MGEPKNKISRSEKMKIERFIRKRNEALFSLDEDKITGYMEDCGIQVPTNKEAFWLAVHKAICNISDAPEELTEKSKEYIAAHGDGGWALV